jgi:hypothetical protein
MDKSCTVTFIVITVLLACLCCLCVASIVAIVVIGSQAGTETPTPVVIRPTMLSATRIPTMTPRAMSTPIAPPTLPATSAPMNTPIPLGTPLVPQTTATPIAYPTSQPETPVVVSTYTLKVLEDSVVPVNDLRELASRLKGVGDIPETVAPPAAWYTVGDRQTFWVTNVDSNENFQIEAVLRYVTDHSYFWIEDGVRYQEDELSDLAEAFETKIYPTNREFFGSEWSPGIDGDPHIYVLYAGGLGWNLAGYYSSADEYHPLAHEYSNAHEMFLFNADNVDLEEEFTYAVLAHEFQHMIHWFGDRNETSWLNEGFSELAAFLNGYDVGGHDWSYTSNPDRQLNDWPNDPDATGPHYGASFLFVTYFLDRFGEDATKALVSHPNNGMSSVDEVLSQFGAVDSLTGQPISADDVFQDWTIASYLQSSKVGDGRYTYHNYPAAPQPDETETIRTCPAAQATRSVTQYGVDYIRFTCAGSYTLHFEGSVQVGVLPEDAHSGAYAFWSNKGDESDMTLTREFDFSDQSGPLTFSYWTWYDLEEDYDYLYLEASTDGQTWQILDTPSCMTEDPSGNSYGCGYNALSGGGNTARWIQETIDLSDYAGQKVFLRFEYITDAAVNGEGLLLDDVAIPEIGYAADFEADAGGWEAAGFVRIDNFLPQTFRLALITKGSTTTVTYIPVAPDITADIPMTIGGDVDEVVLVISGVTRFTRQEAAYRFEVR